MVAPKENRNGQASAVANRTTVVENVPGRSGDLNRCSEPHHAPRLVQALVRWQLKRG